jgi:RimJ/RimL family protein N-acetyltransferase
MHAIEERRTARLLVRRMRADDLDELDRIHRNERVMATLGGLKTREQSEEFLQRVLAYWEQRGFGLWMIFDLDSGRFAGRGGVHPVTVEGVPEVELAYAFMPDFWRRGLATELAEESLRVGFDVLQLDHLVCFTLPTNQESRRVMEKVGFIYERDIVHADLPHVLYRLTAADWRARR